MDKDTVVSSYIEASPGQEEQRPEYSTFVIDDACKNTSKNHSKESTITVPFLVRKAQPKELVPHPWTSLKQLIIVSYCSYLCCFLTGAVANHLAWEALRYRDLGLLSETKKLARNAAMCIYISFVLGMILIISIPLIVVCGGMELC